MHPIIIEYTQRFNLKPAKQIDSFYTNLNIDEFIVKLPYLHDVEKFCMRLYKAFQQNHRICIYSDYDTDAVTATATMYWGLIELGFNKDLLSFYAPDRFTEGYGMNVDAISQLALKNDLIISVDCGINSVAEADKLREMRENSLTQCELIITDHHHLSGYLPNCEAVCNPRLSFDWTQHTFEFDGKSESTLVFLSDSVTGVGVAWFCLVWLGYFLEKVAH